MKPEALHRDAENLEFSGRFQMEKPFNFQSPLENNRRPHKKVLQNAKY
jgi:hypothetical protein